MAFCLSLAGFIITKGTIRSFAQSQTLHLTLQKQEDEAVADGDDAKDRHQGLAMQTLHSFKVAILVNLASTYFASGDVSQV